MANLDVLSQEGTTLRTIEVSDEVFAAEVRPHLFWQVVKAQLANRRSGTASTKSRAEVSGGGRKPFRQKGTGRARQGSTRSYHWVGGGTCHGPKPRDWSQKLSKRVKRAALKSALSLRVSERRVVVLETLSLPQIKTKQITNILSKLDISGKVLFIDQDGDHKNRAAQNLALSVRNIEGVDVLPPEGLNVYDVLRHDHIVVSEQAIRSVEGALLR
jgi:large subunit ribosomal protein L4